MNDFIVINHIHYIKKLKIQSGRLFSIINMQK